MRSQAKPASATLTQGKRSTGSSTPPPKALANGDRVALPEFGLFTVSNGVRNGNGNNSKDESAVDFDACPEFAAALNLSPGHGDQRRNRAGSKCRSADVVIDADHIATDTQRGTDSGLSKADAKKALDGFINATTKALKSGETASLIGFGSFSISKRSARTGRNPQTGKEIEIAAKNVVKFKAGAGAVQKRELKCRFRPELLTL